jgi:hypothetical protein
MELAKADQVCDPKANLAFEANRDIDGRGVSSFISSIWHWAFASLERDAEIQNS